MVIFYNKTRRTKKNNMGFDRNVIYIYINDNNTININI